MHSGFKQHFLTCNLGLVSQAGAWLGDAWAPCPSHPLGSAGLQGPKHSHSGIWWLKLGCGFRPQQSQVPPPVAQGSLTPSSWSLRPDAARLLLVQPWESQDGVESGPDFREGPSDCTCQWEGMRTTGFPLLVCLPGEQGKDGLGA